MINIEDKAKCTGCTACESSCPTQCITLVEDEQGFRYPKIYTANCINCGKCERVCPVINPFGERRPLSVIGALNKDSRIRQKSSSGGIFYLLGLQVLSDGGAVCGVGFDNNGIAKHRCIFNKEDLEELLGSKYVQSELSGIFKEIKELLKTKKVLFSGTPCQVAGLYKYLGNTPDNLLTIEVVCHGVPSPMIWRQYLETLKSDGKIGLPIVASMRDKTYGWRDFSLKILSKAAPAQSHKEFIEASSKNIYLQGFMKDLYLRPSCYLCPAKTGKSQADISLADFWQIWKINPAFYDNKGTSLILINSEKGKEVVMSLGMESFISDYNTAVMINSAIQKSVKQPQESKEFWKLYDQEGISCIPAIVKKMTPTLSQRIITRLKRYFIK